MAAGTYALSVEQLGVLAEKTLVNARELLDEAKALGLLGHCPRAFSLAVLAAEEFGKHLMCFGAVGLRADDEELWKEFHQRFRSHSPKYENMFLMATAGLPAEERPRFLEQLSQHIKVDQARKMSGFYVDLVDGEAVHPAEVIEAEEVTGAIIVYDTVLSSWEARWEDTVFEDLFAEALERGAEEFRYALEDDDRETIERFFGIDAEEEES